MRSEKKAAKGRPKEDKRKSARKRAALRRMRAFLDQVPEVPTHAASRNRS
jgi:hypothetical protein